MNYYGVYRFHVSFLDACPTRQSHQATTAAHPATFRIATARSRMALRANLSMRMHSCELYTCRQFSVCMPRRLPQQPLHSTWCWVARQPAEAPESPPVSCGVPITSYSNSAALEAVSTKTFACTMCGKCCTLAEDAEVTAGCLCSRRLYW